MKKRLYFLLSDVTRAKALFNELLLAGVQEPDIHVVAKPGTPLGGLPEASVLEKSDAVHGAGLGLFIGAVTGIAVGGLMLLFPPSGMGVGLGVILGLAALGAVMGVWVSGMIGSSTPNTELSSFRDDIRSGRLLMLVDVPAERVDEMKQLIRRQHPDVDLRSADVTPAPSR